MNWILFIQSKKNIPNVFLYQALHKLPELISVGLLLDVLERISNVQNILTQFKTGQTQE
jgi:hypothetical protein